MFELPVSGGEVGETNARIIADQFHKLKFGDRFFFSHEKDSENNVPGLPIELKKQIFRLSFNLYTMKSQVKCIFIYRRPFSSVLCDILPIGENKKRSSKLVNMPKDVFLLTKQDDWLSCGDILQNHSLDFDSIAKEILTQYRQS